ncbi:hypothetical protein B0H14DRAFT_2596924 [Mycena olivaceomarginata]|nr:hypothetical protein B0H14DRAFT_2596924 [Mycena olivaceomarginata]
MYLYTAAQTVQSKIGDTTTYWQDVRRRAKEAKAARTEREARAGSTAFPLGDGGHIFTFVPGRHQPYTSTLHPSGKLVTLATPIKPILSEQTQVAKLAALQKKRLKAAAEARAARARTLNQKVADADAALLARFQGKQMAPSKKR